MNASGDKALDAILDEFLISGGTDLHLAANRPPFARVRGQLVPLREGAIDPKELEAVLVERLTPAQKAQLSGDLDVTFILSHRDKARLRVTYYVKNAGIAATFRRVATRLPSLSELAWARRFTEARRGLVLVAGPAGSGKSTLAAALIDHVRRARGCHVLTVEAPIEFVHDAEHVTQREVGEHVRDVASALASARREDADVVYVSDLTRAVDLELALELASLGALVIASVEAGSARSALDRVVSRFEPTERGRVRRLLSESLVGVVVQQLVREGGAVVPAREILVRTPAIAALIRSGATSELASAMRTKESAAVGMKTLDSALDDLKRGALALVEELPEDRTDPGG